MAALSVKGFKLTNGHTILGGVDSRDPFTVFQAMQYTAQPSQIPGETSIQMGPYFEFQKDFDAPVALNKATVVGYYDVNDGLKSLYASAVLQMQAEQAGVAAGSVDNENTVPFGTPVS